MALTLSKTGITDGSTIQVGHVTQSIDAFTKVAAYDITLSGSLTLTGSLNSFNGFTGSFTGSYLGTANLTGSFTGSHFGAANLSGSFTGSFIGPLAGTASGANFINNSPTASYLASGSGAFLPGALGILAGSTRLSSGVSPAINPNTPAVTLQGKKFQTQYWVTATKASGSTSPSNNALMVQETAPLSGVFLIKDVGASTNDDVNFIVVYLQ